MRSTSEGTDGRTQRYPLRQLIPICRIGERPESPDCDAAPPFVHCHPRTSPMLTTPRILGALTLSLVLFSGTGRSQTQGVDDAPRFVLDADTGITLPAGFDAEVLYSVPESQGSWVAMAFDPQGRLIVSDQDDKGVFRVTLPPATDPTGAVEVESLPGFPALPVQWGRRVVSGALGFLQAFDSLYMATMRGFYRVRDTDGDDAYDEFTLLKELYPGWEHSAHSIVRTADGMGLLLVSGNHSRLPDGVRSLLPPVWGEDSLLPSLPDPQGHAVGIGPPGGWICRISPDGSDWTMIASGLRNSVDLAINREGELFTYDSDLEFDIGSPWYRPTRVLHVTSASEFGWRAGSAKWPAHCADSNGAVVDIGPGSPTAIAFGYGARFPAAYREALFLCDWTFGTIYTLDLVESGSSYTGTARPFLSGAPLNIAAMRFGPDGHMYFVIGGRNTASKLYRVRWVGGDIDAQAAPRRMVANQELRDLRHRLEAFHGRSTAAEAALALAWPCLAHDDRDIRYAARVAIECQDVDLWREKVFAESSPRAVIHGTIALCRHGDRGLASRVLKKLGTVPFAELGRDDRLALLRAYALCLIRLAPPSPDEVSAIVGRFDPFYPAGDRELDAELCALLASLDAPTVVRKTLALMASTKVQSLAYDRAMLARHEYGKAILETMANTPNSQNIHYTYALRRVQSGWTLEDRKTYFTWLNETLEKSGGKSFAGYIRAIREDAIAHLPAQDAAAVSWLLGDVGRIDLGKLPFPAGPAGNWTLASAAALFTGELAGRDHDNGKKMFAAGRCVACHRFDGEGGYAGPDLGSVGKRYAIRDILVAICDPSASISEQYVASMVTLKSGDQVYGRVIYRNDQEIAVAINPYDLSLLEKRPAADVVSVEPSPVSMMPPGTIAMMSADELADLMAYLVSGGDKKHAVFRRK
ncbi:MAG: c-type cytochrome [Planctomycetota bacterium]